MCILAGKLLTHSLAWSLMTVKENHRAEKWKLINTLKSSPTLVGATPPLHTSISCLNKQSHRWTSGAAKREKLMSHNTRRNQFMWNDLSMSTKVSSLFPSLHTWPLSLNQFLWLIFSCATQNCVRLSSFFSWLRQSHMFLIFVYSRRGDKNWEAESRVKSFCGTFERSRVSNPSHESPPAIAWLNWNENISR